jgi:hypothetical protein
MEEWFDDNHISYRDHDDFQRLQEMNPNANLVDLLSEYGATCWLEINYPDYAEFISEKIARYEQMIATGD